MRTAAILGLSGLLLLAACSKGPVAASSAAPSTASAAAAAAATPPASAATPAAAPVSGPPVSGTFTANGKAANLAFVTAHKDDPFDGQPITALVFTSKDQGGDDKAAINALFGHYGDAFVVRIQPDGTIIGTDVRHAGLPEPTSVSISGPISMKSFKSAGGQLSGEITSGGPVDVFDDKINVDVTFHVAAP